MPVSILSQEVKPVIMRNNSKMEIWELANVFTLKFSQLTI